MNKANINRQLNCAIYTRKSTDEGLDKEFNSLDAQRECAEAYIKSQTQEGWHCVPDRYDDGGFTGGNMDRPALRQLLADIEAGKVNCVVVYKVDRLSRSLMDFARMLEVFERNQVAFVSVTQQFNTTNSMGRLMLNVLLSFAQFERELISERTRDKIAAARRKGKWSGGMPLLGIVASPRRWTNDRVIAEIQERYVQGEPKHIQGLGDIRLALAAKRRFGSWASAVAAAGLADRIPIAKPLRRWTRKQVIESIQRAVQEGITLNQISSSDQGLYNAAKTHFGSWRAAVRAAGLPTTRQQWTKASILAGILARHQRGSALSSGHPDNINLAAAASRYFGSWTAALAAAGVKSTPTPRRRSS